MGFKRNGGFIDRTVLVAANGDTLELHGSSRRYALTEEDYGMPPIEYVSQRGIFQDGESLLAQYLRPRPVQLVVRWSACSRAEYWNNRNTLLEFVRPARSGPIPTNGTMALRKYLANGKVRQLGVVPDASPVFGPRNLGQWDEFAFSEALKFIAHDPTWYDPAKKTATSTPQAPATSLAYFTEDWSSATLNATKWQDSSSGGSYTLAGDGKITLSAPGGGSSSGGVVDDEFVGATPYTLLDSFWLAEIITPPTYVDSWADITIYAKDVSGPTNWRWFSFWLNDFGTGVRKLNIQLSNGSSDTSVYQVNFNPIAHRHVGATIAADGIRWWASPDGVTWNLLHYDATLITDPAALCDLYDCGMWVQGANADSEVLGPINTVSPPTGAAATTTPVATVRYGGTWREFPVIKITGPVDDPVITNAETGETLTFTGLTVAGGTTLTIDLTYGNKSTVLSGGGGSVLGYLDATSDLVSFHLAPAPEVSGGVNHIGLTGTSMNGNTAVEVQWYDRFIGI